MSNQNLKIKNYTQSYPQVIHKLSTGLSNKNQTKAYLFLHNHKNNRLKNKLSTAPLTTARQARYIVVACG